MLRFRLLVVGLLFAQFAFINKAFAAGEALFQGPSAGLQNLSYGIKDSFAAGMGGTHLGIVQSGLAQGINSVHSGAVAGAAATPTSPLYLAALIFLAAAAIAVSLFIVAPHHQSTTKRRE